MKVIGLVGWSGSGKTTLLVKLLPLLRERGLRVSTLKHAHHGFDLDAPGKDSYEHRAAGATEVLISSGRRFALMHELREELEWPLADLLEKLTPVDLAVVEGFKSERHPKIEVHRPQIGKPPLFAEDPAILAVCSDADLPGATIPVLRLDDIGAIADMLLAKAQPLDAVVARLRA